jgi:hypothetical protein
MVPSKLFFSLIRESSRATFCRINFGKITPYIIRILGEKSIKQY